MVLTSTPELELCYFNIKGKAESARLAFAYASVPFTDTRVNFEQMKEMKETLPFGQLPTLKIGGSVTVCQSGAILRYAGKLSGLYPSEPLEAIVPLV